MSGSDERRWTRGLGGRFGLFARLWGIAMVAHVVGNWTQPDLPDAVGWANLAVGLCGLALSVRPQRWLLLAGSVLVGTSLVLEIPFTGSHWMLAGLAALALLVTGATPTRTLPALRWVLLVFYGFAAFAKLNSAFVDTDVSCAVFYADQSLDWFGLGPVGGPLDEAVVWGSLLTELSVPVLIAIRRTRFWGVVLALLFHGLISFDLNQHFYDFTAVLLALFVLFLPDATVTALGEAPARLGRRLRRVVTAAWLVLGAGSVWLAVRPLNETRLDWLETVPFVFWIVFYVAVVATVIASRAPAERLALALAPAAIVVVVLTGLNGVAPYFEAKTAFSFNMYSNLALVDGESNHLLIRRSLPLRDGYKDPVAIVATSDPGLLLYQQRGYLVAYPQLRRYLADHPDISLTYRQGPHLVKREPVSADPALTDPGPLWWRFLGLRAVDTQDPPRCQTEFLPAL